MKFLHTPLFMPRMLLLFLLTAPVFTLRAQTRLGDSARVSLLTCSPSEEAVFTVYGHTALRVSDPVAGINLVFNYGIFDFSKSNFIYHFAKGETDYKLGITHYENFLAENIMRGIGVTEQVLDLSSEETNTLWDALCINALPENATYRYNFFSDNCATRPAVLIERIAGGQIVYRHEPEHKSFRELINICMRNKPWLIFGCQLALGSPADREATVREEFFLPLLLEKAFSRAVIATPQGERPLVEATHILLENHPESVSPTLLTPWRASLLLCVFFLLLTLREWRKKTRYALADCSLSALAGLGGTVLFFLAFISQHPATWPNWSVLWLHPLHLAGAVCMAVKTWKKAAYYYHFINFATLTLLLASWNFIPQHFHPAFLPLVITLWMRSGWYMARRSTKKI